MPGIEGFFFKIWDPVGTVRKAIQSLTCGELVNEAEAEYALFAHLESKLGGLDVRRQFPYDRIRADILVERRVAIEVKYRLTTTSEFQRLIGQLESYERWGVQMIVVVFGDLDPDLKRRIEQRLERDWGDDDVACLIHLPFKRNDT